MTDPRSVPLATLSRRSALRLAAAALLLGGLNRIAKASAIHPRACCDMTITRPSTQHAVPVRRFSRIMLIILISSSH
jgi:hypothetical protein